MNEENTVEITAADVAKKMRNFEWPDYLISAIVYLIYVAVGLYYCFANSSKTVQDYLIGGRSMKSFPIAMSLVATFFSGISMLGLPTEIYVHGTEYFFVLGGLLLMAVTFQTIYLPILYKLKITSLYEYLGRRFDWRVRLLGSILFSMETVTWLAMVIYVPALAFSQVTGLNINIVMPISCFICIFYTAIGGLKAVVSTDFLQIIVMIIAMVSILIKGTVDAGGLNTVFERNLNGSRVVYPGFDANPLVRHTMWSLIFGGSMYWLQICGLNQNIIQRYASLPNYGSAIRTLWIFIAGTFIVFSVCTYAGLLIYATYYKCDPLSTSLIKEKDQLLLLLVVDTIGSYRGLTGLFLSGVFGATLSSISTGLNSMSAVVLEDFYKTCFKRTLTQKQSYLLLKMTILVFGGICLALAFIISKLGTILQVYMSLGTITAGPSFALFTMGILLPWINSTGALIGGIFGLVMMSWICVEFQLGVTTGNIVFETKPVNFDGCYYNFTPMESKIATNFTQGDVFPLFRISYLWYTMFGGLFSIMVAVIVSLFAKPTAMDVNEGLIAPFMRRFIKPPNKKVGLLNNSEKAEYLEHADTNSDVNI